MPRRRTRDFVKIYHPIAISCIILAASSTDAATLNVPADHPTIQACIDAAVSGVDECVVAPGTYIEAINFNGKAITLRSSGGAGETTIDGNGAFHVVQCVSGEGPDTMLKGFTITGGGATGVSFPDDSGGGMFNDGSSPTVIDCTFSANTAVQGGGMYNYNASNSTAINCTFIGNASLSFGGAIYNRSSNPTVANCTFTGNTATLGVGHGGAIRNFTSRPEIVNCTFSGNSANVGGAIANSGISKPTLTNCILWGDSPDEIYSAVGSSSTVSFSDVQGDTFPGTSNINIDPQFVDADGDDNTVGTLDDDLRLQTSSQCIDVGTASDLPSDAFDLDDDDNTIEPLPLDLDGARRQVCTIDMGAYEDQTLLPVSSIHNVTRGIFHCAIQEAIDFASSGDEIVVAAGNYNERINFLGKAITLRSFGGAAVTTIDGNDTGYVVQCVNGEGLDTILDGFTITGGARRIEFSGGGMLNNNGSSPTVTHCMFIGNSGGRGGGMHNNNSSSPNVTQCTFKENAATFGGGMANSNNSSPKVKNCTFEENHAGSGGAMVNREDSNPIVFNCIFRGNEASHWGAGMHNLGSNPEVTYCTFIGNTTRDLGGGIHNRGGSSTVSNCTFIENMAREDGGAMYNDGGNHTVTHCKFIENMARNDGGGMYNDGGSHTVTDCTFIRNSTEVAGGGIANRGGSPSITNSGFYGNTAGEGGGMHNYFGGPHITNCTFSGNSARDTGGGMYNGNFRETTVTNCTFSGNKAKNGGAMANARGNSTRVANSILYGDNPEEIFNEQPVGDYPIISFSDVQDGLSAGTVDGGGNIDSSPLFVRAPDDGGDGWGDDPDTLDVDEGLNDDYGDLRLQAGSPCVDTGSAALLPADVADVDGDGDTTEPLPVDLDYHPRVLCGEVDMGAYEFGIGDFDCNDVVNLNDFANWSMCVTGPDGGPYPPGCEALDFDADELITLRDFGQFQSAIEGG